MAEGTILEAVPDEIVDEEQEGPQEVPSVFSITNHYLVWRMEISPPAEDGSRTMRLYSASGGAVIEANLSPQLCAFAAAKFEEVEIIEEEVDAEVVEDAGSSAD